MDQSPDFESDEKPECQPVTAMPARPKAEESGERDKDPPGGERKAGSSEDKRDTGARGGEDRSQRADAAEGQPWLSGKSQESPAEK